MSSYQRMFYRLNILLRKKSAMNTARKREQKQKEKTSKHYVLLKCQSTPWKKSNTTARSTRIFSTSLRVNGANVKRFRMR